MVACLHCKKYIFDKQNVNRFKRMTTTEYIESVYRKLNRTNDPAITIATSIGVGINWEANKSECELCGAPHVVFTNDDGKVVLVRFFFSGLDKPSEKDVQFINHFTRDFFGR